MQFNYANNDDVLRYETTLCPRKKGATDFFAVTFTNIDGFS